jgi:hypothetical protein
MLIEQDGYEIHKDTGLDMTRVKRLISSPKCPDWL